jgi:hypothetical protein
MTYQQHYSQALTPSHVIQTEDAKENYFSMPNSSKHVDYAKVAMPASIEIQDGLSHLKDE